jgi:hypothetical protein
MFVDVQAFSLLQVAGESIGLKPLESRPILLQASADLWASAPSSPNISVQNISPSLSSQLLFHLVTGSFFVRPLSWSAPYIFVSWKSIKIAIYLLASWSYRYALAQVPSDNYPDCNYRYLQNSVLYVYLRTKIFKTHILGLEPLYDFLCGLTGEALATYVYITKIIERF